MAGKYVGFSYDFTPGQFAFLLFGRKVCPTCGGRLRRTKAFEEADSSILESKAEYVHYKPGKVKRYRYTYSCPRCGGKFTLEELAEKKG